MDFTLFTEDQSGIIYFLINSSIGCTFKANTIDDAISKLNSLTTLTTLTTVPSISDKYVDDNNYLLPIDYKVAKSLVDDKFKLYSYYVINESPELFSGSLELLPFKLEQCLFH